MMTTFLKTKSCLNLIRLNKEKNKAGVLGVTDSVLVFERSKNIFWGYLFRKNGVYPRPFLPIHT
jgi:hypothetical protein